MKLHHLGIAVESLKQAIPIFEKLLGRSPTSEEVVEDQKVRAAIFEVGESHIELLEATAPDSPIARFIASLEELERSGVRLIDTQPRLGAGNQRVAFLHPKSTAGILIELTQETK